MSRDIGYDNKSGMTTSKEPNDQAPDLKRSSDPKQAADRKSTSDGNAKCVARTQESEKVESEQCAKYLKALADPARIRILKALQSGPLTGTDLSNLLDIEIPNVSHHLRVLYHAGIVNTRRDGRFIYYEIDREVIAEASVSQTLDFGCCSLKMT